MDITRCIRMHRMETILCRYDWDPIFRKYNVSAYLAGHDHDLTNMEFAARPTSFFRFRWAVQIFIVKMRSVPIGHTLQSLWVQPSLGDAAAIEVATPGSGGAIAACRHEDSAGDDFDSDLAPKCHTALAPNGCRAVASSYYATIFVVGSRLRGSSLPTRRYHPRR